MGREEKHALVRSRLRRLVSEPLVHFVLLGGVAYLLGEFLAAPEDERALIIVTQERKNLERARLMESEGRLPTEQELRQSLHEWVKDEALYREGVRLGLDHDDELIRRRVIEKVKERGARLRMDLDPTEEELRAFLKEHEESYREPVRYDLQIYRVPPEDGGTKHVQAQKLLERLEKGEALPPAMQVEQALARSVAYFEEEYGPDFARRVTELPEGKWAVVPSSRGLEVVKVTGVRGGEFSPAHKRRRALIDLRKSKEAEAREQAAEEALRRFRVQWEED